jgi:hypothetical protein
VRALLRFWHRLVLQRYRLVIYTYSPRQGAGQIDERILALDRTAEVPPEVRRQFIQARGWAAWVSGRWRMTKQDATLLCLMENGKLCAYGWHRRFDPFFRRYRWLTPRATLLGYFWTAREERGRGLYGRLLDHCIAISDDRTSVPVIVYAVSSNRSSLRGLEKAGFARLGEYEMTCRLFGAWCKHRVISQETTIAQVLASR